MIDELGNVVSVLADGAADVLSYAESAAMQTKQLIATAPILVILVIAAIALFALERKRRSYR